MEVLVRMIIIAMLLNALAFIQGSLALAYSSNFLEDIAEFQKLLDEADSVGIGTKPYYLLSAKI